MFRKKLRLDRVLAEALQRRPRLRSCARFYVAPASGLLGLDEVDDPAPGFGGFQAIAFLNAADDVEHGLADDLKQHREGRKLFRRQSVVEGDSKLVLDLVPEFISIHRASLKGCDC